MYGLQVFDDFGRDVTPVSLVGKAIGHIENGHAVVDWKPILTTAPPKMNVGGEARGGPVMLEMRGCISCRRIGGHRIGNHLIKTGKCFRNNTLVLQAGHQAQNGPGSVDDIRKFGLRMAYRPSTSFLCASATSIEVIPPRSSSCASSRACMSALPMSVSSARI